MAKKFDTDLALHAGALSVIGTTLTRSLKFFEDAGEGGDFSNTDVELHKENLCRGLFLASYSEVECALTISSQVLLLAEFEGIRVNDLRGSPDERIKKVLGWTEVGSELPKSKIWTDFQVFKKIRDVLMHSGGLLFEGDTGFKGSVSLLKGCKGISLETDPGVPGVHRVFIEREFAIGAIANFLALVQRLQMLVVRRA